MAFLFKILCVEKALSIQAHPDKSLAEKLHATRPDIYQDDNHKPELAIAIDDNLVACFGFLTSIELRENMRGNRVLSEVFCVEDDSQIDEVFLKKCVHKMFYELDKDLDNLEKIILKLQEDILSLDPSTRSAHQSLFLTLLEQYGTKDIGLIFIFFFNIFRLKKDQALVIIANEPHVYISGDIIEGMINSNNVVRGGLTPKYKDTETLYNMLPYEMKERQPAEGIVRLKDDKSEVMEFPSGF